MVSPVCGQCQTPLLGPAAPRLAGRPRLGQDSCRGRTVARCSIAPLQHHPGSMTSSHDHTSVHLSGVEVWLVPRILCMYPGPVSGSGCSAGCGWAYSPTFQARPRQPPATGKIGQHQHRLHQHQPGLHQRGENIRGVDTGHWLLAAAGLRGPNI